MNTHRVTLSAFGTTGVLLAASLTMLAIVSALVTFDAWPTRDRDLSPAEIAIQSPRAARVVSTTRASATDGSRVDDGLGAGVARAVAARLPGLAAPDGGGGGDPGNPTIDPRTGDLSPTPHVGPSPPGEGDPNPDDGSGIGPSDGDLVGDVTATACGTVGAAGEALDACGGSVPQAYEDPYAGAPADVDVQPPADVEVSLPALP